MLKNQIYTNQKELTKLLCQLFFCVLLTYSLSSCNSSQSTLDDDFYKQYILEDQGAESTDTSFSFNVYKADLTGDKIIDPIYIATYMDNYFGYVFNGSTGEEIPQSGWVNFISKPGREMHLEFKDLTCDEGKEIIQYSIAGQLNNDVHFDLLSYQNDSLVNVFSKVLTWKTNINSEKDYSHYYSLIPDSISCNTIHFQKNLILEDSIQNKIEFIVATKKIERLYHPIHKTPRVTYPEKYKFDFIENKFRRETKDLK